MHTRDMNTTQTITIKGRTYTFTTEGAEQRNAVHTLGSLFNSRGQFAGYVIEHAATGRRNLLGGPKASVHEERAALAGIVA
jgi:hypothetical protein